MNRRRFLIASSGLAIGATQVSLPSWSDQAEGVNVDDISIRTLGIKQVNQDDIDAFAVVHNTGEQSYQVTVYFQLYRNNRPATEIHWDDATLDPQEAETIDYRFYVDLPIEYIDEARITKMVIDETEIFGTTKKTVYDPEVQP